MTSLAVRLETSSTTQGGEEKRLGQVENERSRGGGGQEKEQKQIRQAAFCSLMRNVKRNGGKKSDANEPCERAHVCAGTLPNDSSVELSSSSNPH